MNCNIVRFLEHTREFRSRSKQLRNLRKSKKSKKDRKLQGERHEHRFI